MDKLLIEAHIADIHFGALDPLKQFNILKEQFLDRIAGMKVLDIISINGDLFHHKFMANSDAVFYALQFFKEVLVIAEAKNASVIVINGTYSHDADQIKLLYPLAQLYQVETYFISHIEMIYTKGKRILCIPEEYGKPKEYYEKYLYYSDFYNGCCMHGTVAGSIYGKTIPTLDSPREPIFGIDHFCNCAGPIIAGHVHTPGCFGKHIYYCGSPYRWQFGEEEDKGFIILLHDLSNSLYAVHYQKIISDSYITINIDDMINNDPKKVIEFITHKMQAEHITYLRVQITQNNPENINILQTYYRNNSAVRIDARVNITQSVEEGLEEEKKKYFGYEYLFDKNIPPEDKLVKYINQSEGSIFLTREDLIAILKDL